MYFFSRRDIPKLTCLTAKFQEDLMDLLREILFSFIEIVFKLIIK